MSWKKALIPLACVPVIILLAYGFRTDPKAIPSPLVRKAAPGFRMAVFDGGQLSLEALKGKPVVLNFWGSWCGPCRDEAPILSAAETRWRDRGVLFLGVDSKDAEADALAFEEEFGIRYHSVVDADGSLGVEYGVFGYPETFFIDPDGVIRTKQVGPIDADTLETYIAMIAG